MHPWKISLPVTNVANLVEDHVARGWPELVLHPVPGLWFTGSRVWSLLYPGLADPSGQDPSARDWDVFALEDGPVLELVDLVGLARFPACRTSEKRARPGRPAAVRTVSITHAPRVITDLQGAPVSAGANRGAGGSCRPVSYDDGYSYLTDRGEVDLWVSTLGSVVAELRDYPAASHAHCMAAYSLEDGLVVLPNTVMSSRSVPALPPGARAARDLPDDDVLLGPVLDMAQEWAL